jgi:hypothetical protein
MRAITFAIIFAGAAISNSIQPPKTDDSPWILMISLCAAVFCAILGV